MVGHNACETDQIGINDLNKTTCDEWASLSLLVLRRVWRPNVRPSHPLEFIVVAEAVEVVGGVHILSDYYNYY